MKAPGACGYVANPGLSIGLAKGRNQGQEVEKGLARRPAYRLESGKLDMADLYATLDRFLFLIE